MVIRLLRKEVMLLNLQSARNRLIMPVRPKKEQVHNKVQVPTRWRFPVPPPKESLEQEQGEGSNTELQSPPTPVDPEEPADTRETSEQEQGTGSNMALPSEGDSQPGEPADTRESPAHEQEAGSNTALPSQGDSQPGEPADTRESSPRGKRARRKQAAAPTQKELVEVYQDAIRSLDIDFIQGTIDGQKMRVKHVVGFCKTILDGIQVPFNGKIFNKVLVQEAEKAHFEYNREALEKSEKMVSRAAMFAAEPASGSCQVGRWRNAGLELQKVMRCIFQRIQDEPVGRLAEDQFVLVEIVFAGTAAVLDGTLSAPPNKQRYTDGLFPTKACAELLRLSDKKVSSDCIALVHQLTELFFVAHVRSCEILAKHAKRKSVNMQDLQVLTLCTKSRFNCIAREDFIRGCASRDVSKVQLVSATLPNKLVEKAMKLIPGTRIKKAFVQTMPLKQEVAKEFSCVFTKTLMCVIDCMHQSAEKAGRQEILPIDVVAFLRTEAFEFAGYDTSGDSSEGQKGEVGASGTALPGPSEERACEQEASAASSSGDVAGAGNGIARFRLQQQQRAAAAGGAADAGRNRAEQREDMEIYEKKYGKAARSLAGAGETLEPRGVAETE